MIDENIRAAAFALFLESGFEAASMDAVATRAPVSKATLYARYENKEQLFRAVMQDELERLSARAGENDHLLPEALEPRLRQHARRMVEVFSWPQFQAFMRLLDAAEHMFPDVGVIWREMANGHYLRFLTEDIFRSSAVSGITRDDAEFYARLFLHALAGWHMTRQARADDTEFIAFADRIVDVIAREIGGSGRCEAAGR